MRNLPPQVRQKIAIILREKQQQQQGMGAPTAPKQPSTSNVPGMSSNTSMNATPPVYAEGENLTTPKFFHLRKKLKAI